MASVDPPSRSPVTIRVRTLGGFAVTRDGAGEAHLVLSDLSAALLVFLAVERTATRDQLIALLWPERDGRRARHSLSQVLYELKGTLGPGWVERAGERLSPSDRIHADAVEFEQAVERGAFEDAFRLYRGPFLAGTYLRDTVPFERWVDRWRDHLADLHRGACREAAERHRDRGDRAGAIAAARRWAESEPFAPHVHRFLIELLLEEGDRRGALRQYERYERRLQSEGMMPAPEVTGLMARIEMPAEDVEGVSSEAVFPPPVAIDSSAPRLVVLPFEHLGDPEDERFTEGITEEVTSRLAQLSGLAVIARTSANRYRGATQSIAQVRRELGVDYVLEGAVRWDDSAKERRVRVSSQLIRASDATHLWADSYEATLGEVFRLQTRLAERVVDILDLRLRPPERRALTRPGLRDPDASELYVRGMRRLEDSVAGALEDAVGLFQQAIELEPGYARAYAGLAATYALIPSYTAAPAAVWLAKAESAAERAISLDPACAEAHSAAGMIAFLLGRDMEGAEDHLRRALDLTASDTRACVFLAYVQCVTGRTEEAFETMRRAHALDPLSVSTNFHVGFQAWQGGDRDLAARQLRLVSQLAAEFDPASYILGGIHYLDGDLAAARREWAPIQMFGPPWRTLLDELEEPAAASAVLDRIVALAPGAVHWYGVGSLYALLGAPDQALTVLESHFRNVLGSGSEMATAGPSLAFVATDPFFDPLRSEPGFEKLLGRLGLS
jgi:TolB-like protein/DNA-binding SARP family transcriptional activator/Flp pilus assembly protein TadD